MKIGVLALQGDFREHILCLHKLGVETAEIRLPGEMEGTNGLIIPGGESTTIAKLMVRYGLVEAIKEFAFNGYPVYGTCAGLIVLAKHIIGQQQPALGLMDVSVSRNAYGRQRESFETTLKVKGFDLPFPGVFIRAPVIERCGPGVETLALYNSRPVMVRERNMLATSFHPEMTEDLRVHEYFAGMALTARESKETRHKSRKKAG